MSVKVKRGLGLLAVAALGYLLVPAAREMRDASYVAGSALELVAWTMAGVGLLGGLVLLAWGLLRD